MIRRGLILVPEYTIDPKAGSLQLRNVGGESMEQAVRERLPYWDIFDLPDNPLVGMALSPSLQLLQDEGIVRKTDARPQNFYGTAAELWIRAQFEALRLNEIREPGAWSLAQDAEQFWSPPEFSVRTRAIEANLYHALPVPGPGVTFQDILEFKLRRAAELAELRAGMDDLYLSIAQSADVPRAKTASLERLERALAAIEHVTSESWALRLRSSIKVDVSLPSVLGAAAAGSVLAASFTLPLALGAGLGAAAGAIKLDLKQESALAKLPSGTQALAYAIHVKRELTEG